MTTSELIDLADDCAQTYCEVCKQYKVNCWGTFDLIEKLRNRLEKAFDDLNRVKSCTKTCANYDGLKGGCQKFDCDYKWRGDSE